MHGSLTCSSGVLYVGRAAKTAWVSSFDLDGRALETHFSYRESRDGQSGADGLSMDTDRRLWIADGPAGKVRAFTLFVSLNGPFLSLQVLTPGRV